MGFCEVLLMIPLVWVMIVCSPFLMGWICFATSAAFCMVLLTLSIRWTKSMVSHLWFFLNGYGIDEQGRVTIARMGIGLPEPPEDDADADPNTPPQIPTFPGEYPPIREKRIKAWCAIHGVPVPVKNPNDYDQGYDSEAWKKMFPVTRTAAETAAAAAAAAATASASGSRVRSTTGPSPTSLTSAGARQLPSDASKPPPLSRFTIAQRQTNIRGGSQPRSKKPAQPPPLVGNSSGDPSRGARSSFDNDPIRHLESAHITNVDESVPEDPVRFGLLPSQGILRDFETIGGYPVRPFTQEDLEQLDALNGDASLYPEYYNHPQARDLSHSSQGALYHPGIQTPGSPGTPATPSSTYEGQQREEDALAELIRVVKETAADR